MPRHARRISNSGIHHVMLRGINRQLLFHSDDDMQRMIATLSDCVEITKSRLHAYCIMSNHVHLLLQTGVDELPDSETLAQVMKRIEVRYAYYYNTVYNRIGTMFQERYRSEAVESDAYFLTALRYIHRNPVKAGIVETPDMYRWSSYNAYTGKPGFVYTKLGLDMLGGSFVQYMNEDAPSTCIDIDETLQKMTDADLSATIDKLLNIPASVISLLPHDARDDALRSIAEIGGIGYRQLSRVTRTSPKTISHAVTRDV